MPAYSRKPRKLFNRGMNLNTPLDAVPESEFAYLLNVRSYKDGTIQSRPGIANIASMTQVNPATDYVHSEITLNVQDPDAAGGSKRFIGYNDQLWWSDITYPAAASFVDGGYSGNPLSMIGMSPVGSPIPFVYVADSAKMQKYSSSYLTAGVPYAFTIGVPQSAVYAAGAPLPTISGGGDITGSGYYWRWQLRHTITGAKSIPGAPTYTAQTLAGDSVSFADPAILITGLLARDQEFTWDLYRFGGTVAAWKFIGSVGNRSGLAVVDDFTDLEIESAEVLPTDAESILYAPFLSPDILRQNVVVFTTAATATASGVTGGSGSLVRSNGFNPNWIPGTTILLNGTAYTIARVISPQTLYLYEDLGGDLGAINWSVADAQESGFPVGRMFGPFGSGQFGLYNFAVGNPRAAGTLFWTNGNDPDSVSLPNSLDITGPSEPLQNGCIWDGRVWVWSSERLFQIIPDLTNPGQFVAKFVPGSKGMVDIWAFAVGDGVYWKSKDGIYQYGGSGLLNLSDHQLYDLLGHDGQNGSGRALPDPEGGPSITVEPPDPNRSQNQRMCWYDGVIYFDYVDTLGRPTTLSYDTHITKGWTLDRFSIGGPVCHFPELGYHTLLIGIGHKLDWMTGNTDEGAAIELGIMSGADLLGDLRTEKVIGDAFVGSTTNGSSLTGKVLADLNERVVASAIIPPSGSYQQTIFNVNQGYLNFGDAAISRTVGFWIHGDVLDEVHITDWEPSWVPKVERVEQRATDWSDDGTKRSKYLKACIIRSSVLLKVTGADLVVDGANSSKVTSATYNFDAVDIGSILSVYVESGGYSIGQYTVVGVDGVAAILDHPPAAVGTGGGIFSLSGNRAVEVQVDGGIVVKVLAMAANKQETEYAYSIPPVVCKEMRLVPLDAQTCQIFDVQWIWDEYPEYLNIKNDFYMEKWPTGKYVRGVALEGDSQGAQVQLNVEYDGQAGPGISLIQTGKSLTLVGFSTPFIAKEIRIIPMSNWRKHSIRWIYDEYPDFASLITAWEDGERIGDKFLRGGVLRFDSNGVPGIVELHGDTNLLLTLGIDALGETDVPFVVPAPRPVHLMRWVPVDGTEWRYWKTRWDFDPYPEYSKEWSPIMNLGTPSAKFMQGVKVTADSEGQLVQLRITYDGGTLGIDLPLTAWNGKQTIPFSFPFPFIAHNLRIEPQQNCRVFLEETEWIWEPVPDLAKSWITQETDHDIPGYHAMRDGWLAYISAVGAATPSTLTIEHELGINNFQVPVSLIYTRLYMPLPAMKSRWRKYTMSSPDGLRLFVRDTTFRVRGWGDAGPWKTVAPFGDISRAYGARI